MTHGPWLPCKTSIESWHRRKLSFIYYEAFAVDKLMAYLKLFSKKSLRPRPHVSGYLRIRNFFFPDTATVHTYPANSTANPEKNISATNPITCGRVNPDVFDSDDVKSVSNLSPNNKPIWWLT